MRSSLVHNRTRDVTMAHGVDGFDPKVVGRLELRHHGPCRIHQRPVLPLRYTILLRGIRCGILMLDSLITQKLIQGVVLELGAVVTSYCQDLCIVLSLSFICKVDDGLLGLALPLEEIYPSVSWNPQSPSNTFYPQDYQRMEAQRDPSEGAPKASLSKW